MKQWLATLNVATVIFVLLGLRSALLGSDVGSALAFTAAASILCLERYIAFKRGPDINAELQIQLNDIRTYVTAMAMKQGMRKEPIEAPEPGKRWF